MIIYMKYSINDIDNQNKLEMTKRWLVCSYYL